MSRWLVALGAVVVLAGCGPTSHTPDSGVGADGGGALTLDGCFAGLSPTSGSPFVGTLSFESLDGSVRVRFARQPGDRPAVGETYAYDLVRFGIERDGQVECVSAPSALMYDFGHHNWSDTATAEGATTYQVVSTYDFSGDTARWVDTLRIGQAAPITLRATACDVTPLDLNHCLLRSFP